MHLDLSIKKFYYFIFVGKKFIMSQPISTSLQIGAIFEILLLSLIGVALPFVIIYYRNTSKRVEQVPSQPLNYDARVGIEDMQGNSSFNTMKAVSVGVMLGLAMVRLNVVLAEMYLSTVQIILMRNLDALVSGRR